MKTFWVSYAWLNGVLLHLKVHDDEHICKKCEKLNFPFYLWVQSIWKRWLKSPNQMWSKYWSLWNTAYLNGQRSNITCNTLRSTNQIWAEPVKRSEVWRAELNKWWGRSKVTAPAHDCKQECKLKVNDASQRDERRANTEWLKTVCFCVNRHQDGVVCGLSAGCQHMPARVKHVWNIKIS